LLKNTNTNKTVKKKVNFINSPENGWLSASCKALSFEWLGSISWHSILYSGSVTVLTIAFGFPIFSVWVLIVLYVKWFKKREK
jgi:hypothetical protein